MPVTENNLPRRQAAVVFLVFATAYFLSALLRAVTATLAPTLSAELDLDSGDLGLLAGGYFLGFAAMQLPLGRWLDRHGPRVVIVAFLSVAVLGCALFAWATSFSGLLAARVLTGAGVSACLMAALTGYRRWFTPAMQLRANSWMLMTGSMGMVAATLPVQWLVPIVGWRGLFWVLSAGLLLAMVLLYRVVPGWSTRSMPATPPSFEPAPRAGGYADVWRHPYFRKMAPVGFINYGGMLAIQTLWAGPWLVDVAGMTPAQSAAGLFGINLVMLLTFWCWGWITPIMARRQLRVETLMAWCIPAAMAVLLVTVLSGSATHWGHWALFCVLSTGMSLAQPAVAQAFPAAMAGRALSAYNLVIFAGIFTVQWVLGLLIDGFERAGLPTPDAFRATFASYLGLCALAYAYFLLIKAHNRPS